MLKRVISVVIIIVLSITLIIVSFKYKGMLEESNWKQNNANIGVKGDLSIASASFAGNSLTIENGKNFNYNRAMSMIASASQLFQFTSYSKDNNDLSIILDNLCNLMENVQYKDIIIQKSNSIYEALLQLSVNPGDKNATGNLSKLIEEIRQNK